MKPGLFFLALATAVLCNPGVSVSAQTERSFAEIKDKTQDLEVAALDPLIERAKTAVRNLLTNPATAKFDDLRVRKALDGDVGVCGIVDAKDVSGTFTGRMRFVFDGEFANIEVVRLRAPNPTWMSFELISLMLGRFNKSYERFCK